MPGTLETTVLRIPKTSYEYIANYFSWCSPFDQLHQYAGAVPGSVNKMVHRGNEIGGVIKKQTQERMK